MPIVEIGQDRTIGRSGEFDVFIRTNIQIGAVGEIDPDTMQRLVTDRGDEPGRRDCPSVPHHVAGADVPCRPSHADTRLLGTARPAAFMVL